MKSLLLQELFARDSERLECLERQDPHGSVLSAAEKLLEIVQVLPILGLNKLTQVGELQKFRSQLSELRVAAMFARLGQRVELLEDQAHGRDGVYTPDLLVTGDAGSLLVEVFHASAGVPDITTPLDRALKDHGLAFSISCYSGVELSAPGLDFSTRRAAETTVKRVIALLVAHLRTCARNSRGTFEIESHTFRYEPSPLAYGYAAGGTTALHLVQSDEHAHRFLREVRRKAEKQPKLAQEWRSTPFAVAYDNRENELFPETVFSALTGKRSAFHGSAKEREEWMKRRRVAHPPEVAAALSGAWGDLLRAWDFGTNSEACLISHGAFVAFEWARNISATLITHVSGHVQWLPNPFASANLCDVALLALGLPTRGHDWQHAAWQRYP